jgi:hypothetical protein
VRKATEQNTRIRLLVRDVHDTHKHGPLQRATATITTGERPKLEHRGGAFQPNAFQNNTFQVGTPVLEIVQDDGTKHLVENVITDALTYWEGELSSLGLELRGAGGKAGAFTWRERVWRAYCVLTGGFRITRL